MLAVCCCGHGRSACAARCTRAVDRSHSPLHALLHHGICLHRGARADGPSPCRARVVSLREPPARAPQHVRSGHGGTAIEAHFDALNSEGAELRPTKAFFVKMNCKGWVMALPLDGTWHRMRFQNLLYKCAARLHSHKPGAQASTFPERATGNGSWDYHKLVASGGWGLLERRPPAGHTHTHTLHTHATLVWLPFAKGKGGGAT